MRENPAFLLFSSLFDWQPQNTCRLSWNERRDENVNFLWPYSLRSWESCTTAAEGKSMTESSFRSRRNEMAWLTDDASLLRPPCRSAITPSGWTRLKGCPGQEEDGRERRPHAIYSPACCDHVRGFFFFFLLDKEPFTLRGCIRLAPFWRSFKVDAIVSSRFSRVPRSIVFLQDLTQYI